MKTELINLLFIIASCFIIYFIYKNLKITASYKEGMTDASGNEIASNGVAGNAAAYGAAIKAATIQLQDVLLVSKYRSDYETVVLNLDDLINNLMLKTTLSINPKQPVETIMELSKLGQAKVALNSVMKFIDSQ